MPAYPEDHTLATHVKGLQHYYYLLLTTVTFTNLFLHARLLLLSINCIVLFVIMNNLKLLLECERLVAGPKFDIGTLSMRPEAHHLGAAPGQRHNFSNDLRVFSEDRPETMNLNSKFFARYYIHRVQEKRCH